MAEKTPIYPTLRALKINESATFPIERALTVRKASSELSLLLQRDYTANQDRETRTIKVTRIA